MLEFWGLRIVLFQIGLKHKTIIIEDFRGLRIVLFQIGTKHKEFNLFIKRLFKNSVILNRYKTIEWEKNRNI